MKNTVMLLLVLAIAQSSAGQSIDEGIHLFMPDGQLKSHLVRVFVTHDVTEPMTPKLYLGKPGSNQAASEKVRGESPWFLARNQTWTTAFEGKEVRLKGTLMLFSLVHVDMPFYKAVTRISPALTWTEQTGKLEESHTALTASQIYLGNMTGAVFWTVLLVISLVALVIVLSFLAEASPGRYFTGLDGRYSLSRAQVAAWTIFIGAVVTIFGLVKLEVPEIPESLVALMGLSLATGGISYQRVKSRLGTQPNPVPGKLKLTTADKLAGFVGDPDPKTGQMKLSIPRAQMLFWTGLMLAVFVTKSLLDGALWPVPWEMVTLMGMSQAAYLGQKFVN